MTDKGIDEILSLYEKHTASTSMRFKAKETLERMLPQMRVFAQNPDDREKFMRWLGFVQGIFYSEGVFSIGEMRDHVRKAC